MSGFFGVEVDLTEALPLGNCVETLRSALFTTERYKDLSFNSRGSGICV